MNQEVDYGSDSDQSDEDFRPDKTGVDSDVEIGSGEDSADDDSSGSEEQIETVKRRQKVKKSKSSTKTKPTKKSVDTEEQSTSRRRSTRQTEDTNGSGKFSADKKELESDDDEKSRTDALWADFLSDVKPAPITKVKASIPTNKVINSDAGISAKAVSNNDATPKENEKQVEKISETTSSPKQIQVTEIVDFAGEEVRIQKTVSADSIKENKASSPRTQSKSSSSLTSRSPAAVTNYSGNSKRIATSAGLGSILNQIGKKKKISVLEKTQLDWKSFKQDEGIDEELQTFNKGKDGYLERQDFLQRTDLRQFEIEKGLRQSKRNN